MSRVAGEGEAALKAALTALEAAAATIRGVLAASDPVPVPQREPTRVIRNSWPPPPEAIDLNDGTWVRGFKVAAHIAQSSEATLYRNRYKIGVRIRGRWWIKLDRLNNPTV